MKLTVRRIGNSLGVIVPRATLAAWRVEEGDTLDLTDHSIRPSKGPGHGHKILDELRRTLALAVIRDFTPRQIRAQILANLRRWKRQGVWVSTYREWQGIAERGDDGELYEAMLALDDHAVLLRQSPPYVGLLSREEVRRLNEEATG